MRRAHRRPLIWSLAICDSLGNVSGEMVKCMSMLSLISGFLADLCGSWRTLADLGDLGRIWTRAGRPLSPKSCMFDLSASLCHVPEIIETVVLKAPEIIENMHWRVPKSAKMMTYLSLGYLRRPLRHQSFPRTVFGSYAGVLGGHFGATWVI